MQQFFYDETIEVNNLYPLTSEVYYQLKKVLRANDGYKFRLVDSNHHIFLCELKNNNAFVLEDLNENNELDIDITVVMSLIKNDKFDFALQKLTELGVKRIVPYIANRSVVKPGKNNNKLDRMNKIVREASEQSHRNLIPEVTDYCTIKQLDNYLSDVNLIAYEKETKNLDSLKGCKSITIIIGPEGGFEIDELKKIVDKGFDSVSLGKRILRAETAAIFLSSLIIGANQ